MYTGNYPGSSSGYDPNLPTGWNKWDAEDYTTERKYRTPEDDEEDVDGIREINFWANFNEDTITVVNRGDGSMECG